MVHQSFPGQFKHLITPLLRRGDAITVLSPKDRPKGCPEGLTWATYRWTRGSTQGIHPWAADMETKVIRGEALALKALELKKQGYQPDLIMGHPGWGEMLFLGDVWPQAPQLQYLEFFFGVPGTDTDFADTYAPERTLQHLGILRTRNAPLLVGMEAMTRGLTPTQFQRSVLPQWAQLKTEVIHEGVDTTWLHPDRGAALKVGRTVFRAGDPIITFINRTFEPYRGVHVFLQALAIAQKQHPGLQALLVGQDTPDVSYGAQRRDGRGWLTALKEELGNHLDWNRIHCLGQVKHKILRVIYQISAGHVYLSYPFVLSWSVIEAMSCGCLVIGSNTEPVREVIRDEQTGLLVHFDDVNALAAKMLRATKQGAQEARVRREAREHAIEIYERSICIKKQIDLICRMA